MQNTPDPAAAGMPPQEIPPFDIGNGLLAESPSQLTHSIVETPTGQRLVTTIHTPTTTLTILLTGKAAKVWADQFTKAAATISQSGLIVANGHVKEQK